MAASNPKRTLYPTKVEVATSFGDWQPEPFLHATRAKEGCGQILGEALVDFDAGVQVPANWTVAVDYGYQADTYVGKFVRISIEDTAGTWTALWHGVIIERTFDPNGRSDGAGGTGTLLAAGLGHLLDQIAINRGYEKPYVGDVVDPGFCPPFNENGYGNRSAAPISLPGASPAVTCYVHDRANVDDLWTAQDALELILAAYATPRVPGTNEPMGSLRWTLDPSSVGLTWKLPRLDLHGKTVLEAINTIVNPARGLTWTVSVTGTTATILVQSICPTTLTIGTETIPAAVAQTATWQDDLWIADAQIVEDDDWYDQIIVEGARPWVTITGYFQIGNPDSAFIPDGWATTDDAGEDDPYAWRTWKLNPDWKGWQFDKSNSGSGYDSTSYGLRQTMEWTDGQTSGGRYFNPSAVVPPVEALEITRNLPYSTGFTTLADQPREGPVVITGYATSWYDWEDRISFTPTKQGRFILGNDYNDGVSIQQELEENAAAVLCITMGIREWHPLQVAWKRTIPEGETARRDVPRTLIRREPSLEEWVILPGTVKGINSTGTDLVSETSETKISMGGATTVSRLQSILTILVARYGYRGGTASWKNRGSIDHGLSLRPGSWLGTVTENGVNIDVNAVITARVWDLTETGYGTIYQSDRLHVQIGGEL